MTDNIEHDTNLKPNFDSGRNIWKRLDLLLSFAGAQTSNAYFNSPNSLLGVLSYLRELEDQVQRELDYAVITLKEHWRYPSSAIAMSMGTRWEHDRGHLLIQVPANELNIGWRTVQKRYRVVLKRRFGPDTEIPSNEYSELYREDVSWRRSVMNADEAPLPHT